MYVVFSDLDGTLLDYDSYEWSSAGGGIHHLRRHRVPLVFASSKTLQEQLRYQHEMEVRGPMIVESGSAVVLPVGYFSEEIVRAVVSGNADGRVAEDDGREGRVAGGSVEGRREGAAGVREVRSVADRIVLVLGRPAEEVRQGLREAREETGVPVRGFADLSMAELRQRTGLPEAMAARARSREFSETIVLDGDEEAWGELRRALGERGLSFDGAGPMATLIDAGTDKGRAARLVTRLYREDGGVDVTTIGIGDAHADVPLLEAVDRPVLVERKGGGWADVDVPGLRRVEGVGPHGWERAIRDLLDEPAKQSRPRASIWGE